MLESIVWILLAGFFAGQMARRLSVPALLGMVLVGIALGPQVGNVIGQEMLVLADDLRTIAVMVILMKAGLGLDREKLAQQGTVALRLGFLPGACEAIAVAIAAMWLFQFDFLTGLLLGCIIGAESPAVIVPGMLRLKRLGWGVTKGIPDAILMGSALSDVLLLLVFSLLFTFLSQGSRQTSAAAVVLWGKLTLSPLQLLPLQVVVQVLLGVAVGGAVARLLAACLGSKRWVQNPVQETLVVAACGLCLVVVATHIPIFSGYLAVMAAGFFLTGLNAPLARRLRNGFNSLWVVAEIVLFVLLGATIQLDVLSSSWLAGLLLLAVGTLVGRVAGWYLATLGSNWTPQEKLFLLPGNSAKATVQAAIGAMPLAMGIEGGEVILAIAALSILVTAPLGAWAIPTFAPRLLAQGEVDPTKVAIAYTPTILAAIDSSPCSTAVITKAAERARSCEGEVIVFYVREGDDPMMTLRLRLQSEKLLADITYQFIAGLGEAPLEIVQAAKTYRADEIVISKGYGLLPAGDSAPSVGLVTRNVVSASHQPVIVVDRLL
ncbi:MAG: cation:proton antiporter [Cyanobacteria bacterium J06560_2]